MSPIPKKIYGSMGMVESFREQKNVKVTGLVFTVPTNNSLSNGERSMQLHFDAVDNREINSAYDGSLGQFTVESNGRQFTVKDGHAFFIGSMQMASFNPQTFTVDIDEIWDDTVNEDAEYYVRLIQPLRRNRWNYGIETYCWQESNFWSKGLHIITLQDGEIHTYPVKYKGENYLVTESLFPVTITRMQELAYSIAVGLGLIMCRINLDEYYIVVADSSDYSNPVGLCYKGLRSSIEGQYQIFTSNVWSLEFSLKRHPQAQYALLGIQTPEGLIDQNKVCPLDMDFYSKLCLVMCENPCLTKATAIVIEASCQPMEYQAALYCLALEAITSFINGKQDSITPLDNAVYRQEIVPILKEAVDSLKQRRLINDDGYSILNKRIDGGVLNRQANASKLTDAFSKYGYNLSKIEKDCIDKRNPIFHGADVGADVGLEAQFNYLFHLSVVLHKLCCILLLKQAEFDNYIINNAVLYGFDEECAKHEPVLIKI